MEKELKDLIIKLIENNNITADDIHIGNYSYCDEERPSFVFNIDGTDVHIARFSQMYPTCRIGIIQGGLILAASNVDDSLYDYILNICNVVEKERIENSIKIVKGLIKK